MTRGKFITLEGIDGAGKSSHIAHLADLLRARGHCVTVTREPGGTALGEELRVLLLNRQMHPDTELMLMFAARSEHLNGRILPCLEAGEWVVCDRFSDASYAYQGGGRGIPPERLAILESWVQRGFQPDLTLLFDLDPQTALKRRSAERSADRFEAETLAFFSRVRNVYLERARAEPQRFRTIDSSRPLEEVRAQVEQVIVNG